MTVEISAMQHEDMGTKLEAAWQSGDAPDVYMERGGGELARQRACGPCLVPPAAWGIMAAVPHSLSSWVLPSAKDH